VPPHTCIYIVQFNVDGTEGEESGHNHLDDPMAIPRGWGDGTREMPCSAWCGEWASKVFACNSSKHGEGEADKKPNRDNHEDGGQGNSGGNLVVRGDNVDEESDQKEGNRV